MLKPIKIRPNRYYALQRENQFNKDIEIVYTLAQDLRL